MVNVNALLTSMATLYFNNNTEEFIKQNETVAHFTNLYLIDDLNELALPVATQSGKVSAEINYFPKCCPPEHVYDVKFHKCVSNNTYPQIYDDLGLNVSLIRSNLQDCEVIVDQLIQKFELDNFMEDRSFKYEKEIFSFGNYCLDKTLYDEYVARLCYSSEYCNKHSNKRSGWCLKKCCPDGHVLIECDTCTFNFKCILRPELGLDVTSHLKIMERNDSMALFNDRQDCYRYHGNLSKHQYSIKANGNFLINERGVDQEYHVNDLKYCMETYYIIESKRSGSFVMLCAISTENDLKFYITPIAMIISCIAIFITIFVYVFVYKLKKIIEIIIVCYSFALMIFYILAIIMFTASDLGKHCELIGFVFFFSYISSFSWMNVMCFDIYRTVGSMKTTWTESRIAKIKKMTYYAIYALCVPSVVTLFLYMGINNVYEMPTSMRPEFIEKKCVLSDFVEGRYGHILHSVLPAGVLIVVNIIFFILTLRYYLKAKCDLKQISRTAVNGKHKNLQISRKNIIMVLKLTLVMGFTWIFEIIPSIINFRGSQALQIMVAIFDFVNGLQGFFIFLIFLAKCKTVESLISKLHLDKVLKRNRNGTYQTQPTSSSVMTKLQTME